MADDTIRDLFVRLGVVTDTEQIKEFDKGLSTVKSSMQDVGRVVKMVAAGFVALGGAIFGATVATAEAGDQAAKTGQQIGFTAEEMQEYAKAADLSGASTENFVAGVRRMNVVLTEASSGSKTAAEALKRIGLSADQLEGQRPADKVMTIADALRSIEDEAQRATAASRIFGEEAGPKLIPLLNAGAEGIAQMRQEAHELGLVLSNDAAAASEAFIDRLADAKGILVGLRNQIGAAFLPVFTDLLQRFRDWFVANRMLIQQRIEVWTDRVKRGMDRLGETLARVDKVVREQLGGWEKVLRQVGAALGSVVAVFTGAKLIRWALALGEALGPILGVLAGLSAPEILAGVAVLTAAFVGLYLVIEDLLVFLRGGDSALGRFIEQVRGSGEVMDRLRALSSETKRLFEAMLPLLGVLGEALRAAIQLGLTAMATLAGEQVPEVTSALDGLIYVVGQLADGMERMDKAAGSAVATIGRLKAQVAEFLATPGLANVLDLAGGAVAGFVPGSNVVNAAAGAGALVRSQQVSSSSSSTNNINVTSNNTFNGSAGDPGTIAQMDALNRQNARRIRGAVVGSEV